MAVLPSYRGQGVGSRLLAYLLRVAEEHHRAVSLSVAADNPALRFTAVSGLLWWASAAGP
jgi:ribosomal protein S18 acetylase RimI-like enzyme